MMKGFLSILFLLILISSFGQDEQPELNYSTAKKFAQLPLDCIQIEYPNKLNQVISDSTELLSPQALHPIFYGCFDWHSSVHGHWLLARMMNKFPDTDLSQKIVSLFDSQFTVRNAQIELLYFTLEHNSSFERTYGWAWLLKLYAELVQSPLDETHQWSMHLKSLTDHIASSFKAFLPKLVYPIRVGEHTNTAFGLSLALDYARIVKDDEFESLIVQRSKDFYLEDENCPLSWEPSGFDFISPCLQEAELMSKVLTEKEYKKWLENFLPTIMDANFSLEPGKVLDRTDGKLVHLDGLNFSRAWCLYGIGSAYPKLKTKCLEIGDLHLTYSMDQVVESHYMGSHWLASFLVYALEKREDIIKAK